MADVSAIVRVGVWLLVEVKMNRRRWAWGQNRIARG
jgi:hypothetical protein